MRNIWFEKLKEIKVITKKMYFGYCFRMLTSTFLFFIFLVLTITSVVKLCTVNQQTYIDYSENSNLDYKVYLKENDLLVKKEDLFGNVIICPYCFKIRF